MHEFATAMPLSRSYEIVYGNRYSKSVTIFREFLEYKYYFGGDANIFLRLLEIAPGGPRET
jgi:hypothetical protein